MAQAVDQLEKRHAESRARSRRDPARRLGTRARWPERYPAERNQDAHAVFRALHSRGPGPVDGAARSSHHAVARTIEPRSESRAGGCQSQCPAGRRQGRRHGAGTGAPRTPAQPDPADAAARSPAKRPRQARPGNKAAGQQGAAREAGRQDNKPARASKANGRVGRVAASRAAVQQGGNAPADASAAVSATASAASSPKVFTSPTADPVPSSPAIWSATRKPR